MLHLFASDFTLEITIFQEVLYILKNIMKMITLIVKKTMMIKLKDVSNSDVEKILQIWSFKSG